MNISSKIASVGTLALALSACGGSNSDTSTQKTTLLSGETVVSAQMGQNAASAYTPILQQIYVAFYGRPADPAGLTYWGQQFSNANMPLTLIGIASSYANNPVVKQMVDAFADSIEAQDVTSGTSAAFVNAVYLNAFNRVAESAGNDYWSALVDEGKLTRAQMALLIWSGAQGSDAVMVSKKTQAAVAVTAALNTPAASAAYSGDAILQGARDLLGAITDTTATEAIQAQISAYVAAIQGTPGQYASIARYVGFSTLQRPVGTPSYSAHYTYASGGIVPPGTAGTLTYGLNQTTIDWTRGALKQLDYGNAFMASSSIQGAALLPAITMLCRPLTPASAQPKATDVLVSRSARQLGAGSQLAGQTLSTYREDCGVGIAARSISFDSAGNATFKTAEGVSQIDAATVNAGLNGAMLHDVVNNLNFYFFAYSYVRADGTTGFALVQRISVPATTGILPGESILVWSQE